MGEFSNQSIWCWVRNVNSNNDSGICLPLLLHFAISVVLVGMLRFDLFWSSDEFGLYFWYNLLDNYGQDLFMYIHVILISDDEECHYWCKWISTPVNICHMVAIISAWKTYSHITFWVYSPYYSSKLSIDNVCSAQRNATWKGISFCCIMTWLL